MKARCYSPDFAYTPHREMSPDYLQKKFARIRKKLKDDQAAAEAQKSAKVQMIRKVTK